MILTGKEIAVQLALGNLKIDPFDEKQLNPNSYDMRLGNKLLVYTKVVAYGQDGGLVPVEPSWAVRRDHPETVLDVRKDNPTKTLEIPEEGIVLHPGILYLGSTAEIAGSSVFRPCMDGKSSLGRLGLNIHQTAGYGDTAFMGTWTLEISVIHPLRIYAGMRIGQISFTAVLGEVVAYAGKYQNQREPTASRSHRDHEKTEEA